MSFSSCYENSDVLKWTQIYICAESSPCFKLGSSRQCQGYTIKNGMKTCMAYHATKLSFNFNYIYEIVQCFLGSPTPLVSFNQK